MEYLRLNPDTSRFVFIDEKFVKQISKYTYAIEIDLEDNVPAGCCELCDISTQELM